MNDHIKSAIDNSKLYLRQGVEAPVQMGTSLMLLSIWWMLLSIFYQLQENGKK